MFLLYSLVYTLGVILTAPYYLWRRRGKGAVQWRERFGLLPFAPEWEKGAIWVHAVSVGETLAVVSLARALADQYPTRKIFLSHVTPAGREVGEKRLPGLAGRFYLPLDWAWCVRRAVKHLRPALLVIAETELLPNLLREARRSGARVVLVNARLSDQSFGGYRLARPLLRRLLEPIDWICAQTEKDAQRFRELGARGERVVVTGNLKFDAEPPHLKATAELKAALGRAGRAPLVAAASTMPGEEALLLPAWDEIRRHHPRGLLLVAPRHPARFDQVVELLARQGRSFVRRTALETNRETDSEMVARRLAAAEILVLDTLGELAGTLELADLVFVGGSLVETGGHNLLEPAFWSKAILFGPHMENFRDLAQLFLEADAAVQVRNAKDLARRALELLADCTGRRQLGERAKQVLHQASGATPRVVAHIRELVEADAPVRAGA